MYKNTEYYKLYKINNKKSGILYYVYSNKFILPINLKDFSKDDIENYFNLHLNLYYKYCDKNEI